MNDTTSIDDLPLSSQTPSAGYANNGGGGGGGGAPLIYSPNIDGANISQVHIMNEVMQGVQRASANGMTMIPTRDIPMNPNAFTHDEQSRPNYVPQPQHMSGMGMSGGSSGGSADYIKDHTSMENIVRANARQSNQIDTIEAIYYDLLINKIGAVTEDTENLIQRAAGKYKVIIVSPTSFLAYLL